MTSLPASLRAAAMALLLVLASHAVVQAADSHAAKAREHYQRGEAYYNLEKYKEALAEYEEGYLLKPDPSFLYNIAQCHRLMGNDTTALRFYKRFLGEGPKGGNRNAAEEHVRELEGQAKTAPAVVVAPPLAPRAQPAAAASPPRAQPAPPPASPPVASNSPPPPALAGSSAPPPAPADAPPAVVLVQAPPPAGAAENQPPKHHSRWWLWTLIGVAVAGTAAIIFVESSKGGSDPTCPAGRICQ
jgi:tetratricopeptide (TPR) repeat protein